MYQPTWKDGREVAKGKRDGNGRYEAIAQYLRDREGLPNDMRVLDFGAQSGYFSQRLHEEFGGHIVAIESNRKALAHLAGHKGIRTRIAHYTPDQLRNLGHFDVVLALSVLHHQPNWREYLDALTEIGTVVFVEVSHPDEQLPRAVAQGDAEAIFEAVAEAAHSSPIAETAGYDESQLRPLYVIDQHRHHVHAPLDHSVEQGAEQPVDADAEGGPILDNPVPAAVVEERKETTQNFTEDPEPEPVATSPEKPKRKGPPTKPRAKESDGLSDSQHESSDQLD